MGTLCANIPNWDGEIGIVAPPPCVAPGAAQVSRRSDVVLVLELGAQRLAAVAVVLVALESVVDAITQPRHDCDRGRRHGAEVLARRHRSERIRVDVARDWECDRNRRSSSSRQLQIATAAIALQLLALAFVHGAAGVAVQRDRWPRASCSQRARARAPWRRSRGAGLALVRGGGGGDPQVFCGVSS